MRAKASTRCARRVVFEPRNEKSRLTPPKEPTTIVRQADDDADHAVFNATGAGLALREIIAHATLVDMRAMTAVPFEVPPDLHALAA